MGEKKPVYKANEFKICLAIDIWWTNMVKSARQKTRGAFIGMIKKEYETPLINVAVLQRNVVTFSAENNIEKTYGDIFGD